MAQTTRSSSTRSRRTSSSSSRSTSRNGSSRTSRGGNASKGRSAKGSSRTSRAQRPRRTTSNGPVGKTGEKVAEIAAKARPQAASVRKTTDKVSSIASKAKTPLVAGGAALAGIAGGLALKSRTESRRPVKRFRARALPKSLKNADLSKLDLNAVTDAARRISSIGEQVGDVADAADKTRKKHK